MVSILTPQTVEGLVILESNDGVYEGVTVEHLSSMGKDSLSRARVCAVQERLSTIMVCKLGEEDKLNLLCNGYLVGTIKRMTSSSLREHCPQAAR